MKSALILTYSGIEFDILNPDPDKIFIEDIAHALSMQCRFSGHSRFFYSVAEHSVECCKLASDFKLEALMHDAAEAYLHDMVSPLKNNIPEYREYEDKLMRTIASKFGFMYPLPEETHRIDKKMLFKEQCELMPGFQHYSPGRTIAIPPYLAEKNFLSCFFKLTANLTPAESSIQAINTHSPDK